MGSKKVILMGESMGGLNCVTAMVQQPDLANAAILNAGALDVLHLRQSMQDDRGKSDIGDLENPVDFDHIYQWAPLENMREVAYPPVLMTAGAQDDVVTHANSEKMTAALQHAAKHLSEKPPIHLRVTANLGHGGNISALEKAQIYIERWLWVQKALGLKS